MAMVGTRQSLREYVLEHLLYSLGETPAHG